MPPKPAEPIQTYSDVHLRGERDNLSLGKELHPAIWTWPTEWHNFERLVSWLGQELFDDSTLFSYQGIHGQGEKGECLRISAARLSQHQHRVLSSTRPQLYVWKEKKKYYKITWRLPNKAAKDDYQRQHRCQPAIVGLHELLCTFFFGYKADDSLLVLHFVCDDHDCLTARHLRRSDRPPHWDPVNHMLVTDNWPGT
ncbi:hypothetical protein N2152v2_000235 [Parachlorella kessleri]